ncbi:MAG: bL35 family ribosomal protein [Candidatus Woykebacteria bacterium]
MKKKTKKTVSKRFKVTKTGKLLRGHAYSSHHKKVKSKSRIRRQKEPEDVNEDFKKKIKEMIASR